MDETDHLGLYGCLVSGNEKEILALGWMVRKINLHYLFYADRILVRHDNLLFFLFFSMIEIVESKRQATIVL